MIKTIQQKLMLTLCVLLPSLAMAAGRSAEEAKEVAAGFFQSGDVSRLGDKDAFILAHTVSDSKSNPICYVFNSKDGKGFAIISADDGAMPVIGYSADAAWDDAVAPGSARQLISEPVLMHADTRRKLAIKRVGEGQSKILPTPSWSQEAPFNFNIPNRRLTGCVGVALAEILKYYGYPAARPASLVKDGEESVYNWNAMRSDNYRSGYTDEEAFAVATLVADAAIGIGTDFGMSSSSAFEVKVPYALTSLFGYDAGVSYKKRAELSKTAWDDVIVGEIDADRPVLYCGQDVSSGHAFVCDGYEIRGGVPYFHINWGWGGSANGYYASDALNPVVGKAHSYNDLMTIVYNIKPAKDSTLWSDIHVTSDECQPGLTLDVADIRTVDLFTVRVGALKNISNTDYKGRLAVALFDAAGRQKALLSDPRNFSLWALQISKYADFTCKVPSGTSVDEGDVVGIVSMAGDSSEWLPVAGDRLAPAMVSATAYDVPYLNVTLPNSNSYYTIEAKTPRAILGRDFIFTLTQLDPTRLITLKANGYMLSPYSGNTYHLTNLLEDQRVTVSNQLASTALAKKALWVTSGNLQNLLTDDECASVKDLTLYGTINANDFQFMRDRMKLTRLDISQCSITALGSNPANAIPTKAFMSYRSLQEVILPRNLTTFKNACFGQTGLRSIDIPASVATWEYNVFANCTSLREVIARRAQPAWVNWCVFTNTPQAKLIVPSGAAAAYGEKEYWKDFKEIVEGVPAYPSVFTVTVAERPGVKFTKITDEYDYWPGDPFEFKVETDDSFNDHVMQVYCNATVLTPDANGKYKATINSNSLIHVEFKEALSTTPDTTWKLSGVAGGIGLCTSVVNVPFNQNFTVRANAIKVPYGNDAAKFYAMVLTDSKGGIKEFISSIVSNYYSQEPANITYNFICKVKEATIQPDNRLRLATSYDKKNWQLVEGEDESITYSIPVINNPVVLHKVTMPAAVEGARIEGASSEVVRGMPFTVKASAIAPTQRVTVTVNGENKAHKVVNATVTIPAVLEDLDITISVSDADAGDYQVFNIEQGKLAETLKDCPSRVKLIGSMLVSDFDALRANAGTIIDLDISEVTIKGAMMTGNQIPENAFTPSSSSTLSALKTILLPNGIERIAKNAFNRCIQLEELTIPAKVEYIGDAAFATCVKLKKIIAKPKVAPVCGNTNPFPSGAKGITLQVPQGSEESYSVASTWWSLLTIDKGQASNTTDYWVKLDPTRVSVFTDGVNLNKIPVGESAVSVMLTLPNNQYPGGWKGEEVMRPGTVFKLYDNGVDVFANTAAYIDGSATPEQSWNGVGGRLNLRWIPGASSGPWMPQNHEIDIVFYYTLKFENKEGANGVKAEIVEQPEGCEWRDILMRRFQWADGKMMNEKVEPVVYREGSEFRFQLNDADPKTEYFAKAVTKVLTKPGRVPEYEEREVILESNGGLFTIPALEGDTRILISGVAKFTEEDVIPAEAITNVKADDAVAFTELAVSGDMDEEGFEAIRENFVTLETLNLSQLENEVIPENAFAGMESLSSVIIPETVTEIGAGAFADCVNIETISLPGVSSIGEGAFEGCSSLTSILIPASDGYGVPAPAGAPRKIARSGSGITAESFRGLNPNCLIYLGENNIPDSDDLNIILNKNGNRVAASDIHLDGNHSFNAPASFMLGDHSISYTADVTASDACDVNDGWTTIMLPFQPTEMIIGKQFAKREGSGVHIVSFEGEEAVEFTPQSVILPNRPYLANVCAPFASVPVTFTASTYAQEGAYDVPFTPVPEETVAVGKEFSLYGSYDGQTRPVPIYMLNDEGSSFLPVAGIGGAVRPFSAYLVANAGVDRSEMAIGEHPLWIHNPASTGVAGTKLYRSGKIELASASEKATVYYTVDGSDPKDADGSRKAFTAPFSMDGDGMTIMAVAEYKGNVSDVEVLDFELKKVNTSYRLAHNWNWISQITESPVAVADFATDGIESLRSLTQEAVRDPNFGFVGSLRELLPAAGYKACVDAEAWISSLSGIAFDPVASIRLSKGWNWIGTPVDEGSLLIEDLLAAVQAEEGEMLVGLDGFVQADEDGVWKGTLTHMVPGVGYMFFSNSDKEFVYNIVPAHDTQAPAKAPVAAVDGYWTVDNHRYPSVMPVIAALDAVGDAEDWQVAAFCGNECRGIGALVDGLVMINVHGQAGDVISFRFIGSDNAEMISTTTVSFEEKPRGTFARPFAIEASDATAVAEISVGSLGIVYEDGCFILGGDMSDVKAVEIYDLTGKMIAKSNGSRKLNVGNFDGSVLTVVIRRTDSVSSAKLLVK